jgi:hypothetical protein
VDAAEADHQAAAGLAELLMMWKHGVSVSNSLLDGDWELDEIPTVRDPACRPAGTTVRLRGKANGV